MKKRTILKITRAALLLALALGIGFWAQQDGSVAAAGNTWTVTNTNDTGAGSLREAVDVLAQDGDTINFDLSTGDPNYDPATGRWTIEVLSCSTGVNSTPSRLNIKRSINIAGPGADRLTLRKPAYNGGICQQVFNFIHVSPGNEVSISGVTLTSEQAASADLGGGAVRNDGSTVHLINCAVVDSETDGDNSGRMDAAILNRAVSGNATMTVDNCRFSNNKGGITSSLGNLAANFNTATLHVTNSTFTGDSIGGNVIRNSGNGGTANDGGTANMEITNSLISGNTITPIHNVRGNLIVKNTTLRDNVGSSSGGIETISQTSSTKIINSTFSNNRSTSNDSRFGGAISAFVDSITIIKNSTFINNTSPQGFGIAGTSNNNTSATLEISNSIF